MHRYTGIAPASGDKQTQSKYAYKTKWATPSSPKTMKNVQRGVAFSGVRQVFRGARNRRLRRASSLNTSRHAIQHAGRSCVYVRATQRLLT